MIRQNLGRSTRSIYLGLACLSLALHLLLAFFCLSVLQTACVLPTSSSSTIPRTATQRRQSISHSSSSAASSSHKLPTIPQNEEHHKLNANTLHPKEKPSLSDGTEKENKLSGAGKVIQKVKGRSKLEVLFQHPLYNLPRPELQDDDWLLRVKTDEHARDRGSEEEEREDSMDSDSQWQSASEEEEGYDKVTWTSDVETHPTWLRFHLGISRWELYDRKDPNLAQLTHYLATKRVLGAVQKTGGTQLKLLMSFPNYGQALLKPMKQSRDAETDVNLFYFSDFERHNAEIAAFHLDRLLGFNRIPPVVGRLINVTSEIREITTDHRLSRTFFTSPVGNVCFYGQCEYYCSTENPVCGQPHALEVSLAAMLPDLTLAPRRSWRSPWRRSYSRTKLAQWEKDPAYCDTVKQTPPYNHGTRLVDLIDMAVLDFLMSNMDRHHYETFEKFGNETFLLHLDNGRAFGRHSRDEPSILVPLEQCCRIRRSTLFRLRLLSLPGFRLSDAMRESLAQDPLAGVAPLLSEPHLSALDRRLATVLQEVKWFHMDPMDWLENEDLLRFFRRRKTEMSCMEKPLVFLSQLRDHDLVPEDRYKKVSRMRSKDNMKKGLYDILDWLERQRPQHIKEFWRCVFKDTIMNQYPTLRLLRNSLMDGSYQSDQMPKSVEMEDTDKGKSSEHSEDEEGEKKQANSVERKRKLRSGNTCDEEEDEQAGPSSQLTPRKKSEKPHFSSPLKKGQKKDIWTWPIYKHQLPVTCGNKEGTLNRHRLAKGEKCIVVEKRWFTPNEFERFAGRSKSKNWKLSIRCMGTPLGKLIEEGHLKPGKYYRGCKKTKKSVFPSDHLTTDDEDEDCDLDKETQVSSDSRESSTDDTDEGEAEEQTEQQPEASHDSGKKVFKVTCGAVAGTLHKKRFASGTLGKSIRTERGWMSPVEFIDEASCQTDASWRKDIKYEGEPLSVLIEANILTIHSPRCTCTLCKPDSSDLENQKNDDECSICKSEEEEELVVCDHCPRSFHQKCHLPHVEDAMLGDDRLWMCTFCVFRTNREFFYLDEMEREATMSRQISQCMLQCQYLLLYLHSADEEQLFATNPCLYFNDYSTVIKTPMWLGNIGDKLQRQLYQTVGEFVSDVQLIFTNCASYNRDNAEVLATGNRLKDLFDEEFRNVFNISE